MVHLHSRVIPVFFPFSPIAWFNIQTGVLDSRRMYLSLNKPPAGQEEGKGIITIFPRIPSTPLLSSSKALIYSKQKGKLLSSWAVVVAFIYRHKILTGPSSDSSGSRLIGDDQAVALAMNPRFHLNLKNSSQFSWESRKWEAWSLSLSAETQMKGRHHHISTQGLENPDFKEE